MKNQKKKNKIGFFISLNVSICYFISYYCVIKITAIYFGKLENESNAVTCATPNVRTAKFIIVSWNAEPVNRNDLLLGYTLYNMYAVLPWNVRIIYYPRQTSLDINDRIRTQTPS